MSWTRRDFLRTAIAASTGAFLELPVGDALAAQTTWGTYPTALAAAQVPKNLQATRVLEVFMMGGVSPWETYYAVDNPAYGKTNEWFTWSFKKAAADNPITIADAFNGCGYAGQALYQPFATDSNGAQVGLGPLVMPLRARPDITSRLRMHVIGHEFSPHEAAQPLALTGFRLGSPKLAGVGTAIQRLVNAQAPSKPLAPSSYVLMPNYRQFFSMMAAAAAGQHPGSARPLVLRIASDSSFTAALSRHNLAKLQGQSDALQGYYADEYAKRLTWKGASKPMRSSAVDDYMHALYGLTQHSASLKTVLEKKYFVPGVGKACQQSHPQAVTASQLQLAAHLLTHSTHPAKHVTVIDTSLLGSAPNGGHDTHNKHLYYAAPNYHFSWAQLVSIINQPGENNPNKLNLDDTLVVVNSEFGRSPWRQNGDGRDHYPHAYVTLMFGGPVGTQQKGIVGAINPDGSAKDALHPAETRAATLAAVGGYPFTADGYSVAQINGAEDEAAAAMKVRKVVLGV